MADITVRKIRFVFDEPIALDLPDEELGFVLPELGLSITMPYLEPYLIRTMKVALGRIRDPVLAEDTRRFTDTKSLRFNLAYAEGFEAMTCAGALAAAEHGGLENLPGGEIWAWHMAEEIEHGTVAFGVYQHLVGSYLYRILVGTWAQWHYLSYVRRFARCMADALGRKPVAPVGPTRRTMLRNYLRTWSPWYDPARIEVPPGVDALLARYSALAREAHTGS